jgi:hypothetical protein
MRRHVVSGTVAALAAICGVLLAGVALASPTVYTSQSAFLGAISGSTQTQDFEGLGVGTSIPSGGAVGGTTFTYSIDGLTMQIRDDFGTTSPTHYLGLNSVDGTFLNGDAFTMSFGGPVTALGLYVVGAPGANQPGDFSLQAAGSGTVTSTVPDAVLADGDAYFLGIVDPAGFTQAVLTGTTGGCDPAEGCQYVWNVDDITTARATVQTVEPSSLIVLAAGLAGLAGIARTPRG